MKIHDVAQRSPEWFALRAGKLTGSCAKDMLAKGRGSADSVKRRDLLYKLVAERLSGVSQEDNYVNAAMQWGIDHEADAIRAYEAEARCFVDTVGFCEHDALPVGTSPDGFIGVSGLLSVKCPKTATHCRYLRERCEPAEHVAQNTHELWLTGRDWIDFVSFDPRLPEGGRLFVIRVKRTPAVLAEYEREVLAFLKEVEAEEAAVRKLMQREQAVA